jgi:hypothetical protein
MTKKNKTKLITSLLISSIVFLSGIYVFQVIESGKTNYLIGEKHKELNLLEEETNNLKLAVSKNSNLNKIEDKISELGYSKMGSFDYLIIPSSSVAINN